MPNGTEVFFFTNLGRIDASGKTVNGVARVNFVSDGRSGSGHGDRDLGGAGTRSHGDGHAQLERREEELDGPRVELRRRGGASAAAGENSATVKITIGSALPTRVLVGASPQRITNPRSSTITANVFDEFGNPVQNVPVVFSLEGDLIEETLDSGGTPLFTDSSGRVSTPCGRGRRWAGCRRRSTVTATTANGIDGTVTVFID